MLIDVALVVGLGLLVALYYALSGRAAATANGGSLAADPLDGGAPARPYPQSVARQAGFVGDIDLPYWGGKLLLALVLPLLVIGLLPLRGVGALLVVLLALLGFLLPDLYLLARRRRRQDEIRRSLSYFVDMIVAFLLSGLTLEESFRRAGRSALPRSHPLAAEVDIAAREMEGGRDRAQALEAMAERTGVVEIRSLAAALRLGMSRGAPVRETLEAQSEVLRAKRHEDGLRRVNRTVITAVFPLALCGLPVLLVLVFFPTAVELMRMLAELRRLTAP